MPHHGTRPCIQRHSLSVPSAGSGNGEYTHQAQPGVTTQAHRLTLVEGCSMSPLRDGALWRSSRCHLGRRAVDERDGSTGCASTRFSFGKQSCPEHFIQHNFGMMLHMSVQVHVDAAGFGQQFMQERDHFALQVSSPCGTSAGAGLCRRSRAEHHWSVPPPAFAQQPACRCCVID
jgi:hypothetical protein